MINIAEALRPKQAEVVALRSRGMKQKDIAAHLHISEGAVRHRLESADRNLNRLYINGKKPYGQSL
jgi:DNA-binding NarL/FixJ family response regulator